MKEEKPKTNIKSIMTARKEMFKTKKMGMDLRPPMRINLNVPGGFNLLNCDIVIGNRGEYLVNGGLAQTVSVSGPGNSFKSTFLEFLELAAMNTVMSTHDSFKHKYDTENNISLNGLERLAKPFKYLPDDMIQGDDPRWTVTDKARVFAGEWIDSVRKECMEKLNDKDMQIEFNAYKDYRTNKVLVLPVPTFYDIDSLSELEGQASIELVENKGLDDSNTVFMNQGALKTKILTIISTLSLKTNTYFGMTAQVGKAVNMDTMADKYSPPPRTSAYINQNTKVKGVSDKFFFIPLTALIVKKSGILMNQTTKLPEYPMASDNETATDLHVLDVVPFRNKSGASGNILQVVVSQREGVKPELTDFHNCKVNKFGIEGSNVSYNFVIYPEVKMGRTTVRKKLEEDERLKRAAEITHELMDSKYLKFVIDNDLWCEPEVLYKDVKDLGYDWDLILDSRGWIAPDNYAEHLPPYLSIIDILFIRKGKIPYWYDKTKIKNIKGEE